MTSMLKPAFDRARRQGNIDLILPPFLEARLAVVVKTAMPGEAPSLFLSIAPGTEATLSVTCAENLAALSSIQDLEVTWKTGRQLLEELNPGYGIVVVYGDGGDLLTPDQLAWFRQEMD